VKGGSVPFVLRDFMVGENVSLMLPYLSLMRVYYAGGGFVN
jgi:hypothetical protein